MVTIVFIILQIFFATRAVLKIGEYINNSRHLARKYARIFVRGHYLFREANSFPRAKLEENCEPRGTDNVRGQISEHIFAPNGDYCLYIFAPNGDYCLYSARPPKIPGWIVVVRENFSVNKRVS